ncbi:hypothetical protein N0824_00415 [Microcystis sp. 0824]|nr:hypothetical protein N0824_00415 [Microcystis sp. 0824]
MHDQGFPSLAIYRRSLLPCHPAALIKYSDSPGASPMSMGYISGDALLQGE